MLSRLIACLLGAALLAGCGSAPRQPVAAVPWLDAQFSYEPSLVQVSPKDLFKLDAELEARLVASGLRDESTALKMRKIVELIFDRDRKGFAYRAGHSTVASETWRSRSGDCLSLTVLTFSVARTLGMNAIMQEVQTPTLYGRAGELDVVNQHVNVLFPNFRGDLMVESKAHDVVLDFEPEFAAARRGVALAENGIVARYYNNVAVENMAKGNNAVAYAHFKAAIQSDADYASPYSNLAVLYRRIGRNVEAEALLRRAVMLESSTDVTLHELHRLLKDSGRITEAKDVERRLEERRANDPYHWIGLAIVDLQNNSTREAIYKLRRANDLAPTFAEVHRFLAIAYGRNGEVQKARDEVALLEQSGGPASKIALLRRKLDHAAPVQ